MMSRDDKDGRLDDAPGWLKWTMTFINRIGFPIAVAIYLGYMQLNALPAVTAALNAVNTTLIEVKAVIQENSETMRRMGHQAYGRHEPN